MAEIKPPFNLIAEENVLGSVLIDGEAIAKIPQLSPADFYTERHKWLFGAMLSLKSHGIELNQISIATELTRQGRMDSVGGAAYLSQLIGNCATSLDIEYYANTVKKVSHARKLYYAGEKISAAAARNDINIAKTLDECRGYLGEVDTSINASMMSRELVLGKPRLIQTHPAKYIWNVNGKDLHLALPDIMMSGRFKNIVTSELNFIPIIPKEWEDIVNELLGKSEKLEAPQDASSEQQLKIAIFAWLERRKEATYYEDLMAGCHLVRDIKSGDEKSITYKFFRSTPLLATLKKENIKITSESLWSSYILKWGGIKHSFRLNHSTGESDTAKDLWGLPLSFLESEAHAQSIKPEEEPVPEVPADF